MSKLTIFVAAIAALAVVLPHATEAVTLADAKKSLTQMRANLQSANIANEYIYDRNPNVLTACYNNLHQKGDSAEFNTYIVGCISKALGRTTINMRLKQSITLFCDEALSTAAIATVQRLQRVTNIIGCAITESLGTR